MNSNAVRDRGFLEVLKDFPTAQVNQLMAFHQENGGLSRYVKFRYFFEEIRGESITEQQVNEWAQQFSNIMLQLLIDEHLLIKETLDFIKTNYSQYAMHIVSGSDQTELRQICKGVDIAQYFLSIHGSPTHKNELVAYLLKKHNYNSSDCLLIGDSKNDFEAANRNKVAFMAYNNQKINYMTNKIIDLRSSK